MRSQNFLAKGTAGYLGRVSEKKSEKDLVYDHLAETTLIHGSPETVAGRIRELRQATGASSVVIHYPPYYGSEKAVRSLRLFAEEVMPDLQGDEAPLQALAKP